MKICIMVVPYGDTVEQWFECLRQMKHYSSIGLSCDNSIPRPTLIAELYRRNLIPKDGVYLLELSKYGLEELRNIERDLPNLIKCIITDAPIKYGSLGKALPDSEGYDSNLPSDAVARNIALLRVACND